ncbi:MAG TPA: ASCH domain-containing protein [Franconibacter pulveris]|nr:ASCH domain-containing protein [Franconibacter pulveris]
MTKMMTEDALRQKYPHAFWWSFGDSATMADELAALVISGKKKATCCSLAAFEREQLRPWVGSYHIVLNGARQPACVIRTVAMQLIRFCDVTAELAQQEGEGDLSLRYWQDAHRAFFEREGTFAPAMELVFERFALIETL